MTLRQILIQYQKSIKTVRALVVTAHSQDPRNRFTIPEDQRVIIIEAALLRLFISWETFLQDCFTSYLLGRKSISRRRYKRYTFPLDSQHAIDISTGLSRYVDWSTPSTVKKIARLHFENGEPFFSIISAIESDLNDLKTIRNSTAHSSFTTSNELDALATRLLKRPVSNVRVYDLVLSIDPNQPNYTILETYIQKLNSATIALSQ